MTDEQIRRIERQLQIIDREKRAVNLLIVFSIIVTILVLLFL